MNENFLTITREKHLDHLVRVVPFIVLAYGIQCYLLTHLNAPLGPNTLLILGFAISLMVTGFITYDVRQKTILHENFLSATFLGRKKIISFKDIELVAISEETDSFGFVTIHYADKKFNLYFVDEPQKIKRWIESRRQSLPLAA
jgi:hypothetical protein